MTTRVFTADLIRTLMADGKPRTAQEISEGIGRELSVVNEYLRRARVPGRDQEFRAIDNNGYRRAVRYVIGKGENVPLRPTPAPRPKLTEAEVDAKYRRDNRRFPKVDPTLLNAVNAIVRMGVGQ
jgi:hypothetical protein